MTSTRLRSCVPITPIQEVIVARFKQAGMVRFFAPMIVAKEATKYMSPGPELSITLTAGMNADRPTPGFTVIGSYAGGLHSMVKGLALDMKPIRVNATSPGPVATKLSGPGPVDVKLGDVSGSAEEKRIYEDGQDVGDGHVRERGGCCKCIHVCVEGS